MKDKRDKKIKITELDTHKKRKSSSEKEVKLKKKKSSSKKEKPEKEKDSTKINTGAPAKKRGRPFGAKTKKRASVDKESYSRLNSDAIKIWDMLEAKENDGAITLTQKAMLQTIIKMMPVAEKKFFDTVSQSSVYAFNALITSARELIADVNATSDKSKVLDNILYNILQPQIMAFATFLIDSNHQLSKELKVVVKEKNRKELQDIINKTSKNMAGYAQEMFSNLKERLPSALE